MNQLLEKIFHFNTYIRLVFSSLMVLPIIILIYFVIYFSKHPDCISLYLQSNPRESTLIKWPHHGLLTLWFDDDFFEKNSDTLTSFMNHYQYPGMISLPKGKRCPLSMSKLMALNDKGWEITKATNLKVVNGQHDINDMPASDAKKHVIFDITNAQNETLFAHSLAKTKTTNGWLIVYFHHPDSQEKPMSNEKLHHVLQMIKRSDIPVVVQSQVLKVSQ